MPDNVPITAGVGTDIATDQLLTGEHIQLLKLVDGTANSSTRIEAGGGAEANAIRVTIANNSTGLVSVDDNGATISVDDNGGSLTVDGTVAVTDGGGSFATAPSSHIVFWRCGVYMFRPGFATQIRRIPA